MSARESVFPGSPDVVPRDTEALLAMARPNLYRDNAFRIVELTVDVTAREIAKRQQIVERALSAGLAVPPGAGLALPVANGSDVDALREATRRLQDPQRRLVEELFWFWPQEPGGSRGDEALLALARGDVAQATTAWQRQEGDPERGDVPLHNLAVLAHAQALDWELAETRQSERRQRDLAWQQAHKRWRLLWDSDAFWKRLVDRIRQLDDPRLTVEAAEQIRSSLPTLLLLINANLAARLLEENQIADAQRHLKLVRRSGFPQAEIDRVLRRMTEPVRERVTALCLACKGETEANPEDGLKASQRLMEQARPLLRVIDEALPPEDTTRQGVHDEIASRVLDCDIPYGNRTKDWTGSLALLEEALLIAEGEVLRERLKQNVEIDRRNAQERQENGTCWFCKRNAPQEGLEAEVKMHGEVKRTPTFQGGSVGYRLQWRTATLKVPRCPACAAAHKQSTGPNWWGCLGGILGLLLGGVVFVAIFANIEAMRQVSEALYTIAGFVALLVPLVLLIVGAVRGSRHGRSKNWATLPEQTKVDFPAVKRLQAEGWSMGERPPGAG